MAQSLVLFLSKDIFFAPVVKQAIEAAGARYVPAATMSAATERIAGESVVAAIVDLTPHSSDSIKELGKELADHHPQAARIAFGPHVNTELFAAADEAGFQHVLAKGAVGAMLPKLLSKLVVAG